MTKVIVFDVDGTVADCSHRTHHVSNGASNWKAFFDEMSEDSPIAEVIDLNNLFYNDPNYSVVVVTARPRDYEDQTVSWLKKFGVKYDAFYMRAAGDFRKDSIVKSEILDQMRTDGYDPYIVVDDRKQVVDMWRSKGIMTLHCAPDEAAPDTSKYKGQELLHVMVGASGSGKSTYVDEHYDSRSVISTDSIREQLFGSYTDPSLFTRENGNRTWKYAHDLVKANLENGVFTVLDATNIRDADRKKVLSLVPRGINVKYVVIERPLEHKLKTKGWRPESLVRKHHNTFKSNRKAIMNGDGFSNVTVTLVNGVT